MFRKDLLDMLRDNPMTVTQVARLVNQSAPDVAADLEHLKQSLKHQDLELDVQPALCRKCGFQFSADKLKKPSRCPRCNSSWLTEPVVAVVQQR